MKMNYMEEELERRKSRVGGFSRLKRFASRVGENAPVVAKKVLGASKVAGESVVKGVVAVNSAYDKYQDFQLKKINKQTQIAKAKARRDKFKGKSKDSNRFGFGDDSPNAWFPKK